MRVVVAGSSGLIGTALVAGLRQAGHDVVRLVRRRPAAPDERGWDPPTGRLDSGALDGADAVVNLCGVNLGAKRWSGEYKQAIRNSRIEPTEVLARAVAERGVATMVNASGIGYYGDTGDREVDESSPRGAGFLAGLCRDWEGATAAAGDARVVFLRSGLVMSRRGGFLGRLRPLFALLLGGRLGSGRQYLPWISLDDEIGAIRLAVEDDRVRGPVNLVGPQQVTNAEFTRELAAAMGRPAPWVVPGFALRLVIGEFAEEGALTGQRAVPRVLAELGFPFAHPTLRSALEAAVGK
jgi:uncharacterized protein (TIGR01777 family)